LLPNRSQLTEFNLRCSSAYRFSFRTAGTCLSDPEHDTDRPAALVRVVQPEIAGGARNFGDRLGRGTFTGCECKPMSVRNDAARKFYEAEALRDGWSGRQRDRQINSQFHERVALSRNKASMLTKGSVAEPQDVVAPEEAIKDAYVLEFPELKDEYSESQLEAALIERLETFLLELCGDFAFIGRQRRLRIDEQGSALICCSSTDAYASDRASCAHVFTPSNRPETGARLAPSRKSADSVSDRHRENTSKTGRPCWARTSDQRIMSPLL
jgi:predicted nuclease of restriction endonuclease-like (RecB) superfamily